MTEIWFFRLFTRPSVFNNSLFPQDIQLLYRDLDLICSRGFIWVIAYGKSWQADELYGVSEALWLAVFPVTIPPSRERKTGDIKISQQNLRHVIERGAILSAGGP